MGSNIYLQKICEQCGKEFTARTTVTRFCSHTCSSRAYKDRTRKDKVEKIDRHYPDQNQGDRGNSSAGCTDRIGSGGISRLFAAHSIQIGRNRNDQECQLGPAAHAHQTLRGGFVPVAPGKTRPARERVRNFRMLHRRRSPANIRYIVQDSP